MQTSSQPSTPETTPTHMVAGITGIDQRILAYYSPAFFGYLYLGYNAPWHQREIYNHLAPRTRHSGRTFEVLNEPRKYGKTTAGVDTFPTWVLCTNWGGTTPDPRLLIISEAKTTALKRVKKVKDNLTTNPGILRDYGDLRGDKWLTNMIYCKRTRPRTDPSLEAVGVGGAITGGAYDGILIDDPCSKENTKTAHLRKLMNIWFDNTVISLLDEGGIAMVIGTRKHHQDLYYHLMQNPSWKVIKREAYLKDGSPMFPGKWTAAMLEEIRQAMGPSAWASEFMNSPVPAEGMQFKTDWIQWIRPDRIPLKTLVGYMWLDPAFGKSAVACNNALAILGITPDNYLYLLDLPRWKGDLDMTLDQVLHYYDTWRPRFKQFHSLYIESNFHQKLIPQALHKIRLIPLNAIEQHSDKIARIQSLEPYYASGRVIHADTPMIRKWVHEEYQPFPDTDLIDGLDALSSLVEQVAGSTYRAGSWAAL